MTMYNTRRPRRPLGGADVLQNMLPSMRSMSPQQPKWQPSWPSGPTNPNPGQTPPIVPGQTVPGVPTKTTRRPNGPRPGMGGPNGGTPLPTLSDELRQRLQQYGHALTPHEAYGSMWANNGGVSGGGIPVAQVRRFLRTGAESGLSDQQLMDILRSRQFMQGSADPNGQGGLLRYIEQNPDLYGQVADFASTAQGAGGFTRGQTPLLNAIPQLHSEYARQAGMQQTPDGQWWDPQSWTGQRMLSGASVSSPGTPVPGGTPTPTGQPNAPQPQQPQGQAANTPQAAATNGREPSKHVAYWSAQGWNQNQATGVWTGPNGQTWDPSTTSGQGGTPGPTGGPNAPRPPTGQPGSQQPVPGQQGPQIPQGLQGTPQAGAWPLDPALEAQRRMIEDQYAASTAGIPGALSQLGDQGTLAQARMATNEGLTNQSILEQMAARGTYNSSLTPMNMNLAANDYARQHQDLAQQLASGYNDIYVGQNQASLLMSQQLQQALLDWAQQQAQSQYATTPTAPMGPRGPVRRPRRRR